jgi:sorting nexin-4
MEGDDDTFTSVNWDAPASDAHNANVPGTSLSRTPHRTASTAGPSTGTGAIASSSNTSTLNAGALAGIDPMTLAKKVGRGNDAEEEAKRTPRWEGFLMVQVTEPRKEQEGTKEMFVSYGIRAEVCVLDPISVPS